MGHLRARIDYVKAVLAGFLRVYAQVLFSRSPWVGLALLLATAVSPRSMICGALAVAAATLAALLLELETEAVREGAYGYNAFFLGLGVAHLFALPPAGLLVMIIVGATLCVLVTAALRAWFAGSHLPVLTVPFLLVFYLLLGGSSALGLPLAAADEDLSAGLLPFPAALFLRSLGAVLCLPYVSSGALVLLALLLHSRISAMLAAGGFAVVYVLHTYALPLPDLTALPTLGFNASFTALTLGAVWFVPSGSSFTLGLGAAALTSLLGLGMGGPLARLGLPLLIAPFNAVALLTLLALRMRVRDGRPKAVDFASGTPEENLSYFRTRMLRFRWLYAMQVRLPFRGAWVCTQGVDGELTHKGPWRHAFDFEVRGADGHLFHGQGAAPQDFYCYKLPVVAPAAGTVARVVGDVADNEIGQLNLTENWGNLVLLYHGPGLYSLVAHLLRGSVKVYVGQVVQRGEVLGLCGNSGRSDRPHLHFQLQGTAELGAPTLQCEFNDAVLPDADGRPMLRRAVCPRKGEVLRNLDPDEDLGAYLTFPYGETWAFARGKRRRALEHVVPEVDLLGRYVLRSEERRTVLYYERGVDLFAVLDVVGQPGSALHVLRAALGRVALEAGAGLVWKDYVPVRPLRSLVGRALGDFLLPFLRTSGIEVEYQARREGAVLVIEGASPRKDRRGQPVVRTRVVLARGGGPLRAEVTLRGRTLRVERVLKKSGDNPAGPAGPGGRDDGKDPQAQKEMSK